MKQDSVGSLPDGAKLLLFGARGIVFSTDKMRPPMSVPASFNASAASAGVEYVMLAKPRQRPESSKMGMSNLLHITNTGSQSSQRVEQTQQ